jgi:alpha-tubulin suppressor-like RCC1 family protein
MCVSHPTRIIKSLRIAIDFVTWEEFWELTHMTLARLLPILTLGFCTLCQSALGGNRVVAWGDNASGKTNVPPSATNVVAIAAGEFHSLALRADGTVIGWGKAPDATVPSGLTNVVAIAAGSGQNLALKADGSLVSWGAPSTSATTNIPPTATNIVAVACGDDHNLVLRADGKVMAWGANYSGQTNIPSNLSNVVAICAGNTGNMAIGSDGRCWGSGAFTNQFSGASNLVAGALVASGNFQGAILRSDGTAHLWGYPTSNGSTNVAGIVALCGRSGFNQAGSVWALRKDGRLYGFGPLYLGQTNVYENLSNVLAVAIGYTHHLAIVGDGFPLPIPAPLGASFSNQQFLVQQPTQRGTSYRLEHKDALTDASWTLLPPVPGDGSVKLLIDPRPSSSNRWYRVRRVQP